MEGEGGEGKSWLNRSASRLLSPLYRLESAEETYSSPAAGLDEHHHRSPYRSAAEGCPSSEVELLPVEEAFQAGKEVEPAAVRFPAAAVDQAEVAAV